MEKQRSPAWPQLQKYGWIKLFATIVLFLGKTKPNDLQINNFTASDGWFEGFKKRYNIKEYLKSGEGNSAPLENLTEFRSQLQDVIKNYELRDVFNCDETALFWLLESSRTLSKGVVVGTKKSKERVTVLLTCSALGEKIKPTFIYRHEKSTSIKEYSKVNPPGLLLLEQ